MSIAGARTEIEFITPDVLLCWLLSVIEARYFSVPCDRALRKFLLRHERLPTVHDAVSVPAETPAR